MVIRGYTALCASRRSVTTVGAILLIACVSTTGYAQPADPAVVVPDSSRAALAGLAEEYRGLPSGLRLYTKTWLDTTVVVDSAFLAARSALRSPGAIDDAVTISGYKSVGVSFASGGQANIEQGLDITLGGMLPRGTHLTGHISDQGGSLDGGTRELTEIDRVYLTLSHPRYEITAGDQTIVWPSGGLLSGTRQLKGLGAAYRNRRFNVRLFGAISGGKFAIETIRPQEGLQGPYALSGNGEPDLITPVKGTVRVALDGRELREGDEYDYVVDYDFGSVTFLPSVALSPERVLRVEYEYKTFDYQRTIVGGDASVSIRDTVLTVWGALWNESDNRNAPIDISISEGERTLLGLAGDSALNRSAAVPVDARDAEEWSARYHLYAIRTDSGGVARFVYAPFNPAGPAGDENLYVVHFRLSPGGEYASDTVDYRGPVYRYVGPGLGTATATNPMTLPQRTTMGEIKVRLRPAPWLDVSADVAGMSHDRNLFSSLGDDDNEGAASLTRLLLGRRVAGANGLWMRAVHQLLTRDYTREAVSAYELGELWNTERFSDERGLRQIWEAGGGGALRDYLRAEVTYGQVRLDQSAVTSRLFASASSRPFKALGLSYEGRYFRHPLESAAKSRRETVALDATIGKTRWRLSLHDQWRYGSGVGDGRAGGDIAFELGRSLLQERVGVTAYGTGEDRLYTMRDTSRAYEWVQSFLLEPGALWRVSANSTLRHRTFESQSDQTTLLARLGASYNNLRRGVLGSLDYTLNAERASAMVQVPTYVGEGLGSFGYDSLRGELTPSSGGAYAVAEQEMFDRSTDAVVRKSNTLLTWSLRPRRRLKGLFGDIGLRGELQLIEHVLSDSTSTQLSWIPGYLTLSGTDQEAVRLANCSYEQRISWEPDSSLDWIRGELIAKPYVRVNARGREEGIRARVGLQTNRNRWYTSQTVEPVRYRFDGLTDFDVFDIGAELVQRVRIVGEMRFGLTETGGWARRDDGSGWYAIVRPGISWQSAQRERGWAEMAYTYAFVDIQGPLDYGMARGYAGGATQRVELRASVTAGKHFELRGAYRAEFRRPLDVAEYEEGVHGLSVEVKALL